jgi:hypothetical protein
MCTSPPQQSSRVHRHHHHQGDAKLFGGDKREATWFSMERTHVDDATAGADPLPELSAVSMDMEEITACGSFIFKEIGMLRDPV